MKFCHFWPPLQKYFWPTPGHKCRSRQIFGHAKDFSPKSPKLARKVLCDFCQQIFSHKEPFLVWPPKTGFMCFSANVGHHFLKAGPIFARIFRNFIWISANQNFRGCAFTPCNPASCTTAPGNPLLALAWKKSFRRPFLGVHTHLPKCWRVHGQKKFGNPCGRSYCGL